MRTLVTILLSVLLSVLSISAQDMKLDAAEQLLAEAIANKDGKSELMTTVIIIDGHKVIGSTMHDFKVIKTAVKCVNKYKQNKHKSGTEFYAAAIKNILETLKGHGIRVEKIS